MAKSISVHLRLPEKVSKEIDAIVKEGYYSNANDFIKEKIREAIIEYNRKKEGKK